jgi:hypothetical protein
MVTPLSKTYTDVALRAFDGEEFGDELELCQSTSSARRVADRARSRAV